LKAVILTNGSVPELDLILAEQKGAGIIICVDGGAVWAKEHGITPHMIIGDMDSIPLELLCYFREKGIEIIQYPREKDETDTQIAVDIALKHGADEITILGGAGSRIDHTYGNILLLVRIHMRGARGKILDRHNEIYVSKNTFVIDGKPGQTLSILPLGENVKISRTQGLYYPIRDKLLPIDYPYGVSNVFTQHQATIEVVSGWAIIIRARD